MTNSTTLTTLGRIGLVALALSPGLLGACGSDGESGGGGAAGSGGTPGGLYDCSAPSGAAGNLKLTSIATGLDDPLLVKSPPDDPARLIVAQRDGVIRLIENGQLVATPYLDISGRVLSGGERGLLGVAFHPSFAQNGRFFVHYSGDGTTAPNGSTVISEFVAGTQAAPSPNADTADPGSESVLLTVAQPYSNHNGGSIEFKPGGGNNLFIGLGDGGSGGDPQNNGQTLSTLLGKILRIDVDGSAPGKNYGIPSGNMSGANVEPEIWSYGVRNPWRTTFDPCTGDMYVADVGQNQWEEINVEPANKGSGSNYGWRVMEGTHCYNPSSGCDQSGKVLPVAEYDHSSGCSVTGGHVYRGSSIAWLRGTYIYADYCSGRFWSFAWNGSQATGLAEITDDINPSAAVKNITSFGQDAAGEIYVTSFNGQVYRIDAE